MPLLRIENLRIDVVGGDGTRLVNGVSLAVERGRTMALVGESGCGKSITSLAVMGLLPAGVRVAGGRIEFDGVELTQASREQIRRLRGDHMAMIFQEPMTALNPVMRVGDQIAEPLRVHRGLSARTARRRVLELLRRVGIPAPERRIDSYPHEMSGGMRQRVMIAIAIACEPVLLIADEPTTALDVTMQAQILELLRELQRQSGMAILFITHDLAVVAEFADQASVMYAGRIVESGPVRELLDSPRHPYTQALLRSMPVLSAVSGVTRGRLPVIPGEVPRPHSRPSGCAFHPRCELGHSDTKCAGETPELLAVGERACACWKTEVTPSASSALR
jgi:peptide/nickel transport system ATP-binding protein